MGKPVSQYPLISVNTSNPDPTAAINAFLWCMAKARELGMSPPSEHVLAEHLFRRDATVLFYSSMSGVVSLVMDEESANNLDEDDMLDFVTAMLKRRAQRTREKRANAAAQGMAARSGETETGSTEGNSPVACDAPITPED